MIRICTPRIFQSYPKTQVWLEPVEMIEFCTGDIFEDKSEAIVNAVNCVGVMGKGLALQFKNRYSENFRVYRDSCFTGNVFPGRMLITETGTSAPRWIVNFPTKRHWANPSQTSYILDGLVDLAREIIRLGIKSIAIPPLGCGLGGLKWSAVKPMIVDAMSSLKDITVRVYEPIER